MAYMIPLFDLNYDDKEEEALISTLRSRWISTGPKVEEFEELFSSMINVKYAVALSNCTVSLHLALKLLDVGEGDEVICPSLTFVATVNAIKYVGATAVFCDIKDTTDLNINPDMVEQMITPRTKAIIVMHYGGFPCDMDKILSIANKHGIKVIEDTAHGPLSKYKGKTLGSLGDIGCFSFFSNKNISTGEGGMLVTNNKSTFEKARLLRSHGMTSLSYDRSMGHVTSYDVVELGYNYRMDDMRASLGLVQLQKSSNELEKRAAIRRYYISKMQDIPDIDIPFDNVSERVSNYIFPIVLRNSNRKKRDSIRDKLHNLGIQTSVHYPSVHRFSIYSNSEPMNLPITEYVSDNEISLPMYSRLSHEDIDFIVNSLKESI